MLVVLGRAGRERRLVLDAVAAAPVLAYGADLLVDGGFEDWASPTNLTSYSESLGGTSTVNREAVIIHGGTYAVRLDVDASNGAAQLAQGPATVVGGWYRVGVWMRADSGTPTAKALFTSAVVAVFTLGTVYTRYLFVARAVDAATTVLVNRNSAAGRALYADDLTLERVTLASALTGGCDPLRRVGTFDADCTVTSLYQAGVVCCLDSATSPANYLHGYVDRATGKAHLLRVTGGATTELLSAAVSYVAAATVRVTVALGAGGLAGAVVKLYYNGAQVGASQVVNLGSGYGTLVRAFRTNEADTVRVKVRS